MRADIIAVSDNPLDKIETLKKVSFVMKNWQGFQAKFIDKKLI
jgi:imidazolonepropionase-like amidohydrolase